MAEVVLGFVYRASTNGLGGVYLEAAFAGASGLVALGAKTVSKLREGTREPADGSGTPVGARSANATVQGDDGDRVVPNYALAEGPATSLEPVQFSLGDSTRRLTVQPPLPTSDPSLPYTKFNDTKLNTNIFYTQHDPIDPTSADTDLNHNFTAAEFIASNTSSISTSYADSSLPYATSLLPHTTTTTSICLIAPILFALAAIIIRFIWRRLYLVFARRPISTTGHIAEVLSGILARAVALFRSAALPNDAHIVALPPSSSPSERSVRDTVLRVNEEGDVHEDEDLLNGDSDEDIDDA
ncbi:hypothetical protein EV121DRAFT_298047, partial [Schizophyllum commune]